MLNGFTGWHALVLLVIVVLIFGAAKLPGLAKSVGQSMKIFKNEIKPEESATTTSTATPPAETAGPQLNQTSAEVAAQQARSQNDSSKSSS